MSAWGLVNVTKPARGPGSQVEREFYAQSLALTDQWGAQPAQATVEYVNATGDYGAIAAGASVRFRTIYGHLYFGVCMRDEPVRSSGSGFVRSMVFQDLRKYLEDDAVFCMFNRVDKRSVGGRVVRRFAHILPADFEDYRMTFTTQPYTAAQVIAMLLTAPTVFSPWVAQYHDWQVGNAVLDLDFQGRSLGAALLQLTESQGLVFRLASTESQPYRLEWGRKGYGGTVGFPANSDNRRLGVGLSGNPTRVRVLGGRNRYQLLNVPLVPDWNAAWQEFYSFDLFVNRVYQDLSTQPGEFPGVATGTRYNAISGDTEHLIGRHLARARANRLTVLEYDGLRNDKDFRDARMLHGRSRNDLPARVYIEEVLFRAYRPQAVQVNGRTVPQESVRLVGEMVAKVSVPDPSAATRPIVYSPGGDVQPGNGLAVVRGYSVSEDMFRVMGPAEFKLEAWTSAQRLWSPQPFQIDDSGEDGGFVLFDSPMVRSEDLISVVDGFAVFKAQPTFTAAEVVACLTFEVERFSYWKPFATGQGDRNRVEELADLRGEFVAEFGGTAIEIAHDDGQTANQKAEGICDGLLSGQYSYAAGGYDVALTAGSSATPLTGVIDRVTVEMSPSGFVERVDFTLERGARALMPARDFDRRVRERTLLSSEKSAAAEAESLKRVAMGFRQNRGFARTLGEEFRGFIGSAEPLHTVTLEGGSGTLAVGTPLWRKPVASGTTPEGSSGALVTPPASTTAGHSVFCGAVTREQENAEHPLPAQMSGVVLMRVKGPAAPDAKVVQAAGMDYLVPSDAGADGAVEVGTLLQEVAGTGVRLAQVRLGSGGGTTVTGGEARWA